MAVLKTKHFVATTLQVKRGKKCLHLITDTWVSKYTCLPKYLLLNEDILFHVWAVK